jgi:uncharacterized membrane protein
MATVLLVQGAESLLGRLTENAVLVRLTPALAGSILPAPAYDSILRWILQTAIFLANLAGGLVVGVAIIRGLLIYAVDLIRARGHEFPKEAIRLSLGRSLALALEFQVGADILGTALNPSRNDIEVLGAIVVVRTVLNFFLQRELRAEQNRQRDEPRPEIVPP